jgi:hypothetical protein
MWSSSVSVPRRVTGDLLELGVGRLAPHRVTPPDPGQHPPDLTRVMRMRDFLSDMRIMLRILRHAESLTLT